MKQHAKKLIKHPLIYGSTILVAGGLFANFFNFLFNLFMSRSLSVADYGVLASVISLITFPALIVNAVNPVVVRFAGDYFAKGETMLLRGLYKKFSIFLLVIGIIIFILFLLLLPQISQFFHIKDYLLLFLTDIIIFLSFISITNLSFIQAKLAFGFQVLVNLVNTFLKLILGVLFVLLGYEVLGATGALLIAGIGGYLISFIPIRNLLFNKAKDPDIDTKEIYKYGIPTSLALLSTISFITTDIILVKHFFNPEQAGLYAGLSLIGRIIFFVSAPIGAVMFPLIVQKHSKGDNFNDTFKLALGLVILPSLLLSLFYFFFPKFSILFFLKRQEYLSISPLLGLFGFYIMFYNILYLFANFYLSIKKTGIYIPILIGATLQIILITLYHQSFYQIIMISFVLILLLVIGFLIYYPYATRK